MSPIVDLTLNTDPNGNWDYEVNVFRGEYTVYADCRLRHRPPSGFDPRRFRPSTTVGTFGDRPAGHADDSDNRGADRPPPPRSRTPTFTG
jgi:hypothetical protein